MLDHVTPCALVFDNDGYIRAPSWSDLKSAAAILPEQCSEIEAEISINQVDEGNRVAEYTSGPIKLRFCTFDTDAEYIVRRLTKRVNELGMMLEFAESGSLQIQRMEQASECKIDVSNSATAVQGMPIAEWITRQKQIALRVDGGRRSLGFRNVKRADPYCLFHWQPHSDRRQYFLQDDRTGAWIWRGDLPRYQRYTMKKWVEGTRSSIRRIKGPNWRLRD